MRKSLLLSLAFTLFFLQNVSGQIIISQYYEGSSNNKWLEVTNTGATAIAAGTYYLCNFNNTAADNPSTSSQNGCVAIPALNAGETILFRNGSAVVPSSANLGCASSISTGVVSFNGDDLVIITTTNSTSSGAAWAARVDVIGNGTSWGSNTSFYRNANITSGNTSYTPSEYTQISTSTVDGATSGTEQLCTHVFNPPCTTPASDWTSTSAGLTATFTDISTNAPTSWLWDFGDGNTSTTQNPAHTYATAGTYTICLTVTNACGSDSTCGVRAIENCITPTLNLGTTPRCEGNTFKFEVNFDVNGATTGFYQVYDIAEDTVMATGTSSPITVLFPNQAVQGPIRTYRVRHIDGGDTCISVNSELITPLMCVQPCVITASTANQACKPDGTFDLDVTVNYRDELSDAFAIIFDGTQYGPYDYAAFPSGSAVTIPGLVGDGAMVDYVVVDTSVLGDKGGLYISAILADQASDLNGDGNTDFCDEYVKITNSSLAAIDISGYEIWDNAGGGTVRHVFPATTMINAGETLQVFVKDFSTVSSCGTGVWNNGGDVGYLYDAASNLLHTASYSSSSDDTEEVFPDPSTPVTECIFEDQVQKPTCGIALVVEGRASCMGAAQNEWYVRVDTVYGGSGTGYTVSVGALSMSYTGSPVLLGPLTHSGLGNAVVTLNAADDDTATASVEVVEALCGYPQNAAFCDCGLGSTAMPGAIMSQAAPGSFIAGGTSGLTQVYVLVDTTDGLIDSVNGTGLFTGLANGAYDVYAINYKDDITAGLDVDDPVQDLIDGTMGTGPYAGLCYTVCPKASYTVDCIILDDAVAVSDAFGCDDGNIPGIFTVTMAQAGVMYELLDAAGDTLTPRVMATNTDTVDVDIDLILLPPTPLVDTDYMVRASVPGTNCSLMLTAQPTFIATPTPDLQLQGFVNICNGQSYNLSTMNIWDLSLVTNVFTFYDADPTTGAAPIGAVRGARGRPAYGIVSVSPTVDTDYWVVGTTPFGCADTLMFTVTVQDVPVLDPVGDMTYCAGDTVDFAWSVTPAGSIVQWTNSSSFIGLPLSGRDDFSFAIDSAYIGVVTITGTAFSNGCQGNTESFNIRVNPLPVFATSLNDTVCSGEGANIDLSALNMNSLIGVTFKYDAPVLSAGLTATTATQVLGFESFEGTGGELGYTVANAASGAIFNDGSSDHYNRTDGSDINTVSGTTSDPYLGQDGAWYWAAEDTDDGGGDGVDEKFMTLNAVNIAGQSNVRVDGLFAAGNANGPGSSGYDVDDYMIVEYRVDGGGWQNGLAFRYQNNGDNFNEPLLQDTDFDGFGDGVQLVNTFSSFGFDVNTPGNVLEVRISIHMESANEEVAFDNIQITATSGSGLARNTASADPIVDTYENTSGAMQTACYKVVPVSAAGCEGDTINVKLYVKPAPVLSVADNTVCSGAAAAISLGETTGMSGVSISWDAYEALPTSVFGLNGAPTSGPGTVINDAFANLSGSTVVIPYEVTATSMGGCVGEPDTAYLTVQTAQTPLPPSILSQCEDAPGSNQSTFDLAALSAGIGSNVVWFDDNGMITNPAAYSSGTGAVIAFSPDNCGSTAPVVLFIESTPAMPDVDMVVGACDGNPALIEPMAPAGALIGAESFDGNGVGFIAPNAFSNSSQDHFNVTDGNNISNISGSYTGQDGTFFFAGEDINANGAPNERSVTLFPISIAGFSNIRVDGLFAAGNNRPPGSNGYDAADLFIVEYSVDGSPFQPGVRFSYVNNGDSFNEPIALDTDFDGNGDGPLLTTAFANYGFSIPSGNNVIVRVRVSMNSGSEEIAFDNIRVTGTPSGVNFNFYADAALTQPLATGVANYSAMAPDTVWVTSDNGRCESSAKRVIVEPRQAASITATGDTLVCEGSDCFLDVATGTTGFSNYNWTGPNGFAATGAAVSRTNLSPADGGWYVLEATDDATGCPSRDSVLVDVRALANAGVPVNDTICVLMTDPMFNLRDSLIGAQPRGVWAGPSALMNGDLGTFDPATMSSGYYTYGLTMPNPCAVCIKAHIYVKVVPTNPGLRLTALLEGPYAVNSGLMRDDLRRNGLIPAMEPYTGLGYTFVGGGNEVISSQVLAQTGADAIVDWVVIELRDANNMRTVLHSRAALMQRDGDVVDMDGRSNIVFPTRFAAGTYYVVIVHRNHLGIMTAQPYTLNAPLDLTNGSVTLRGGSQTVKQLGNKNVLMGGDGDGNGQIQNTDQVFHWMPQTGTAGYKSGDFNLNGQVQNTDRVFIWAPNSGKGSQVPR